VEVFPWLHVTPDLQFISPSRKTLAPYSILGKVFKPASCRPFASRSTS